MNLKKYLIGLCVVLILAVSFGPFLIPLTTTAGLVSPDEIGDPDSRFVEVEGVRIHYKEMGEGDHVIILLHGFGASVFSWREVMEPLSEYGRVIAYDRPAFGLTERPMTGEWTGESPYSMFFQDDLLLGLMEELDIDSAVWIGNSMGGAAAAYAAQQHPEKTNGVVLVDAAIYGHENPSVVKEFLYGLPQMQRVGPVLVRSIARTGNDTIYEAWHDPSQVTEEIIAGYRLPLNVANWDRALWEYTKAGERPDIASHLDRMTMPVLVLSGDDDQIIPVENSKRLSVDISDSELVILSSCGHVPQEECPQQFLETVGDFLNEQVW